MTPKPTFVVALAALVCAPLLGCGSDAAAPDVAGARVAIDVAALQLRGVTNACWNVQVDNGQGEQVWRQDGLCADDFGDGAGSVSYVGPCDAATSPAGNENNTITLELVDLYTGGPSPTVLATDEYDNPCPPGADRCQQTVRCDENADVQVAFNVVVMREANQGFFDIAVTFNDIFCSAKFDCQDCDAEGANCQPITLLHDGAGQRNQTVVLALACTAGPGQQTALHMNDVNLTCANGPGTADDVSYLLDPGAAPGNLYSPALSATDFVYQAAIYRGEEVFAGSVPPVNKCYWNMAIGVNAPLADHANCTVTTTATASDGPFAPAGVSPDDTTYPYVQYAVDLIGPDGEISCGENPLNSTGSGVTIEYTGLDPDTFCHTFDCFGEGGPTVTDNCASEPAPLFDCADPITSDYSEDFTGVPDGPDLPPPLVAVTGVGSSFIADEQLCDVPGDGATSGTLINRCMSPDTSEISVSYTFVYLASGENIASTALFPADGDGTGFLPLMGFVQTALLAQNAPTNSPGADYASTDLTGLLTDGQTYTLVVTFAADGLSTAQVEQGGTPVSGASLTYDFGPHTTPTGALDMGFIAFAVATGCIDDIELISTLPF